MRNQKRAHCANRDTKRKKSFTWSRLYTAPIDTEILWHRIEYVLMCYLPDGRAMTNSVRFGAEEPRKVIARRLRYTKMVLLRKVREDGQS